MLIFVTPEGKVLNKIFSLDKSYSQIQLQEASNYITNKFSGLTFEEVKRKVMQELSQQERFRWVIEKIVDEGNTVLGETEESVVISGQDHLFDLTELSENASKLRSLYKLLAQKTQIINLLQSICSNSKGVRVFIGGESALMPEDCLSVVASPCIVNGKVVGSLGVIGPTRMEFQRVVSLVDVTAKLVSCQLPNKKISLEQYKIMTILAQENFLLISITSTKPEKIGVLLVNLGTPELQHQLLCDLTSKNFYRTPVSWRYLG